MNNGVIMPENTTNSDDCQIEAVRFTETIQRQDLVEQSDQHRFLGG